MAKRIDIQREIGNWFSHNGGRASLGVAVKRTQVEFAELMVAVMPEHIREETADVAMCLFMVAEIGGFDLLTAVSEKLEINRARSWTVDADGCLHHVKGSDPRDSLAQGIQPDAAAGKP